MGCFSSKDKSDNSHLVAGLSDRDAYASLSAILQRSENKSVLSVARSEASARWHSFPASHFSTRYGAVSQRGHYPEAPNKDNQDRWCVHVPYGGSAEQALFGVFDGHGDFGSQCAAFAAHAISRNLVLDPTFPSNPEVAAHNVCTRTNAELRASDIDDKMSGTTAILALMRGPQLFVANVGDSRAVLAERQGDSVVAKDLSWDQTPMRSDECARVKQAGARVLTLEQLHGKRDANVQDWTSKEEQTGCAPRLWSPNGKYPGAAFSRSIGDQVAEEIGVTAEPELRVQRLTNCHPFFIVASDGLWEFVPSQTAVDIVCLNDDPQEAAAALVAEAQRRWRSADTRMDDITVLVVQIQGIGSMLPSSYGSVGTADLALLSSQRYGDEPRFIESIQINAHPSNSPPPVPKSASTNCSGVRTTRSTAGPVEGTLGLFPAALARSPLLRAAFHELVDLWQLDQETLLELQECVRRCEYQAGDIVVEQVCTSATYHAQGEAGSGSCILEQGKLDLVISNSRGKLGGKRTLAHSFVASADRMPTFMQLAVFAAQPRAVSVVARAHSVVWLLERSATRSVLGRRRARDALPYLRKVNLLTCMSLGQLDRVLVSLQPKAFDPNQTFVKKGSDSLFGIVAQGQVNCKVTHPTGGAATNITLSEGDYFGELALQGQYKSASTLVAGKTGALAMSISQDEFSKCCGPLSELYQQEHQWKQQNKLAQTVAMKEMPAAPHDVGLEDMRVRGAFFRGACQSVVMFDDPSGKPGTSLTARIFHADAAVTLGHDSLIRRQREISRTLPPSLWVPMTAAVVKSKGAVAEILGVRMVATLAQMLNAGPFDMKASQFFTAGLVVGLEELHRNNIMYRGISAATLLVSEAGYPQLCDLRFAKRATTRTFTVSGSPEYIAPEVVRLTGHTDSVDWWALGVLLFRMLAGHSPFYDDGDSETVVFRNVLHSTLVYPSHFSAEVCDLLDSLLDRCPETRLPSGEGGFAALKSHAFFTGVVWEELQQHTTSPPPSLQMRLRDLPKLPTIKIPHTMASGRLPLWLDEF